MIPDTILVGAGFAGMAAAVALARAGVRVTILETKPFPGGRVYSIPNSRSGDTIDNGQHVFMGCYHQTFDLLKILGTDDGVLLQPQLSIPYRGADGAWDALQCPALPGPLHLLGGLLKMRSLSWNDKFSAIRFGLRMQSKNAVRKSETVEALLDRAHQSSLLRKRMWESISLSALNEESRLADASLLQTVLRQAFFAKASDSRLGIPIVPLQELHSERMVQFLQDHGGQCRFSQRVERLEFSGDRITAVWLSSGERIPCGVCLSAIPAPALHKLIVNSGLDERISVPDLGASAIVSVYLWYDRPVSNESLCCLMDGHYEWIFHRTHFMRPGAHQKHCVCLIASAANRLKSVSRERLIRMAIEDIQTVYPASKEMSPENALVFWEPRATFSATPRNVQKRLPSLTALSNFFLAGDWTATGLPATIEGAVASGNHAASLILDRSFL